MEKHSLQRKRNPVWHTLRTALLLTLVVFFLPLAVFGATDRKETTEEPEQAVTEEAELAATEPEATQDQAELTGTADTSASTKEETHSVTLTVKMGNKTKKMDLEKYLWGVVAAEMPASFEEEALKAQAIAARTYTLYRMKYPSPNHSAADICTDSTCCQAWISYQDRLEAWSDNVEKEYAKKITAAIEETRGQVIYYQDEPIMAAFHASSAGVTKSAAEVWGKDIAYLQAVKSPEDKKLVPNYYSVVTVTTSAFKKTLLNAYPKADLSGKPQKWFGKTEYDRGGLPVSVAVGGVTVPTSALRSLFALRSSSLTVACDGKKVTFYVTGYGHGVGMSQYGADALAKEGKRAKAILQHYYSGVKIHSMFS